MIFVVILYRSKIIFISSSSNEVKEVFWMRNFFFIIMTIGAAYLIFQNGEQIKKFAKENYTQIADKFKQKSVQPIVEKSNQPDIPPVLEPVIPEEQSQEPEPISEQQQSVFEDIPEQIVEVQPEQTMPDTKEVTEEPKQPEPVVTEVIPDLLDALRKTGSLSFTEQYNVSSEERQLFQKYQQIKKDIERKLKDKNPSYSEIQEYRQKYDQQCQNLANQHQISVEQLKVFEQFMEKLN